MQLLIGSVHVFFGFWMLLSIPSIVPLFGSTAFQAEIIYGWYTVVFGLLTLIFTYPLWMGKKWGLLGTIGVSTFVVVADSLTVLDLPSVPGIPKFAAAFEITYSLLIVIYLLQRGLKRKATKSNQIKH